MLYNVLKENKRLTLLIHESLFLSAEDSDPRGLEPTK